MSGIEHQDYRGEWISPADDADFAADQPKGVVVAKDSGTTVGDTRVIEPPEDEIEEHRKVVYTDPHVHEAIETLTDWIVGDGFNVQPRSFAAAMESGVGEEAADAATPDSTSSSEGDNSENKVQRLRRLMKQSEFWRVFNDWVRYALIDGHSYMELVIENGQFKPRLLPSKQMNRDLDQYGNPNSYVLEHPDDAEEETTKYEPHEVAELWFRKEAGDDYGRSFAEPIAQQADILRDMEIDYARFIATKAYPPILWKLGNEEHEWTEDQVTAWMDNVENVGPDSMLAAPHDVETEVVGTTSTSSSAGAMRLEETFRHLENRIVTGLGVPALLMNMPENTGETQAVMPSFKRRVKRLQNIVKTAVEQQILKSLLAGGPTDDYTGTIPEFEFGEHSSAEKRLEVDKLLKLFNNGLLTPEALAERAGIDPQEVPDLWNDADHITRLKQLSGQGDAIQNPEGGRPTDTEGGTDSSGGEVTSRQDPTSDPESGRNRKSVTEDEN